MEKKLINKIVDFRLNEMGWNYKFKELVDAGIIHADGMVDDIEKELLTIIDSLNINEVETLSIDGKRPAAFSDVPLVSESDGIGYDYRYDSNKKSIELHDGNNFLFRINLEKEEKGISATYMYCKGEDKIFSCIKNNMILFQVLDKNAKSISNPDVIILSERESNTPDKKIVSISCEYIQTEVEVSKNINNLELLSQINELMYPAYIENHNLNNGKSK